MEQITWKDFEGVELHAGTITEVGDFPEARKPAAKPTTGYHELAEAVERANQRPLQKGRTAGKTHSGSDELFRKDCDIFTRSAHPACNSGGQLLKFEQFQAMTFDCYGTLIDWETGLLNAIQPLLGSHGVHLSDAQILEIYGEIEPKEQNPYRRYHEVLANIVRRFGERLGFVASDKEAQSLPNSLSAWLPFPDTNQALRKLKAKYKLAIISNTDDVFFEATSRHFGIRFDEVITAEQARAYKPSPAPFRLALQRLKLPPEQVLHVGQSVHHDVLPAKSLGLSTVLVYRRGFGATRPTSGEPDLRVPDLKTLADLAMP